MLLAAPHLTQHGIPHGFSSRTGGVSEGLCATLNVGIGRGDAPTAVAENRARVMHAIGKDGARWMASRQVHGTDVRWVDHNSALEVPADGMITSDPHLVLATLAADCVPILLASDDGAVVAAVHAGWKGTVGRIAAHAVAMFERQGIAPQRLLVAIGPCIARCCFEIGNDVTEPLTRAFGSDVLHPGPRKMHGDLVLANRLVLQSAGVLDAHIWDSGQCTYCMDGYFSHRAQGERTGRQAGVISPKS